MAIEHKFTYKEVDTLVELCRPPEEGEIRIVSPIPTKEVGHEVVFMALMIFYHYWETGEILSVEEARRQVALQYIMKEKYGDIASMMPKDLAKIVEITEELAGFGIQLAKDQKLE